MALTEAGQLGVRGLTTVDPASGYQAHPNPTPATEKRGMPRPASPGEAGSRRWPTVGLHLTSHPQTLHLFPSHFEASSRARAMPTPPLALAHAPPLSRAARGTAHRSAARLHARALLAGSCSFSAAGPASPVAALGFRGAQGPRRKWGGHPGGRGREVGGCGAPARGVGFRKGSCAAIGPGGGQARGPVVRVSSLEDAQEKGTLGNPGPRSRHRPPGESVPHGPAQGTLPTLVTHSREGPTPKGARSSPQVSPGPRPPG